MLPTIVEQNQFDPVQHAEFKKFAQISNKEYRFGKTHKTVYHIFYADVDPGFSATDSACTLEIPKDSDIDVNYLYTDTGEFVPPEIGIPKLYSDAELLQCIRDSRLVLLSMSDALVIRHRDQLDMGATPTLTSELFSELLAYRQALRDFPATCDPRNPVWPTPPSFLLPTPPQS